VFTGVLRGKGRYRKKKDDERFNLVGKSPGLINGKDHRKSSEAKGLGKGSDTDLPRIPRKLKEHKEKKKKEEATRSEGTTGAADREGKREERASIWRTQTSIANLKKFGQSRKEEVGDEKKTALLGRGRGKLVGRQIHR